MKTATRVLIVDDHLMFREGIRDRLTQEDDFTVVGEASNADEALELMESASPDVAILDIRMPGRSGIELARVLRKRWPELKILVLSGYDFDQYVKALARIGIQGYMLKDAHQDELIEGLRQIAAGGAALPPKIASKVMRSYASEPASTDPRQLWDLTMRELEILELLYQGMKNTEISEKLSISPRTVETHVSNIISKLGARTRTDAVRIALDRDLIK
jgi:DNA-binding NarL/FixJ family response regulator